MLNTLLFDLNLSGWKKAEKGKHFDVGFEFKRLEKRP